MINLKRAALVAAFSPLALAASAPAALADCYFDLTASANHAYSQWSNTNRRTIGSGYNQTSQCISSGELSLRRNANRGKPIPNGTAVVWNCRGNETTIGWVSGTQITSGMAAPSC